MPEDLIAEAKVCLATCAGYEPDDPELWDALQHCSALLAHFVSLAEPEAEGCRAS